MSTQKQQQPKQGKTPNHEAKPDRREDNSKQRSNKTDPRGANQTPQSSPIAKRSDTEDFQASNAPKHDPPKERQQPDSGKR